MSKDKPAILLSVCDDEVQSSIQKKLSGHYTVHNITAIIDPPVFDLCIIDEQSLKRHKETLQKLKDRAGPIFLPILLVNNSRDNTSLLEYADEIINIRASAKIWQLRIQILLKQRTYSQLLKKEKSFSQNIIKSIPVIFYMLDVDFKLVHWNDKLEQSLGYTSKEFKSMKPSVYPESERAFVNNKYKQILEQGEAEMEVDVITKSGEIRHHYITGKRFSSEGQTFIMGSGMDITEQKKREYITQLALKEKEVLLQEIHHRVKNNLAVISGLLQLQRFNSSEDKVTKALADSERRIQTMALIHEKLYQSYSLSKINFKPYIKELVTTVEQTMNRQKDVRVVFDCEAVSLNINQAVPCALIINELIANAYEHAFVGQETGKIMVKLKKDSNTVYITIKDDGNGVSDNFRDLKKESMGYSIIDALIKQLDASFEIQNETGTEASFSFEKQQLKGSSSTLV